MSNNHTTIVVVDPATADQAVSVDNNEEPPTHYQKISSEQPTSSGCKIKLDERKRRLQQLHTKRNEARNLNHREVVEEDQRNKLPSNWEARKSRLEWKLNDEEKRKEAEEQGLDYERLRALEITAAEASALDVKKKRKHNPDEGFATYEDATIRQYNRLTKQMKPDMEKYEQQREQLGEKFYANKNTILHGEHKDTPDAIERLVADVNAQAEKKSKFSRRRAHNAESEIDYINEKNMVFNKKLERFYGKYTSETKQNIERGTAV